MATAGARALCSHSLLETQPVRNLTHRGGRFDGPSQDSRLDLGFDEFVVTVFELAVRYGFHVADAVGHGFNHVDTVRFVVITLEGLAVDFVLFRFEVVALFEQAIYLACAETELDGVSFVLFHEEFSATLGETGVSASGEGKGKSKSKCESSDRRCHGGGFGVTGRGAR